MDVIKIPKYQFLEEPKVCNGLDRFSHNAWTKKIPKGVMPCDYDKDEELIEFEFDDGNRNWVGIEVIFGNFIKKTKLQLLYPDDETEELEIVGIDLIKIKRTMYCKLIFERTLPF